MYQTFEIDESDERSDKPEQSANRNVYQFTDRFSNVLKPNIIPSVEEEYYLPAHNLTQKKGEKFSLSNPRSEALQGRPRKNRENRLKPIQKLEKIDIYTKVEPITNKDHEILIYQQDLEEGEPYDKKKDDQIYFNKKQLQINLEEEEEEEDKPLPTQQVQPKSLKQQPKDHQNIFQTNENQNGFVFEEELIDDTNTEQPINIPIRIIDEFSGLGDDSDSSQGEPIIIEKTTQYFDRNNKERLSQQLHLCVKKSHLLCMQIRRDNTGFNTFWPQYQMAFKNEVPFVFAKRTTARPIATYMLSMQNGQFQEGSPDYLGKIKTNPIGNILYVFGPGPNPSNAKEHKVPPREMVATIVYQTTFFNHAKPRSFSVYVKHPDTKYISLKGTKEGEERGLDQLFLVSQENRHRIEFYQNDKPVWNQEVGGFLLNFGGRVKCASVKNFILQDTHMREVMMFGRRGDNVFVIETKDRFSPIISFAVALSSFDSKILCQ